ncbi:MAG: UvrD-helicase domain-containing protein [Betaproteobacteria bacterium]|nr:MAG: UvrD-helicase domain-containing protein [Betaproteobacteria bacterium]
MPKAVLAMSTEQQIRQFNSIALDPANSVVIEACAGSGKTWLLVSRIVRLLLAGVRPSEILAITFTRKAAQEMQARLHEWLHLLATADDDEVRRFLHDREAAEGQIDDLMPRARALFEEFLVDQPGITINTFHGWFLQLLKRAPLAAGAASGTNLVERTFPLIGEAWESFAEALQHNPDSPVAHALNWLFESYGLENTRGLLTNFLAKRAEWWSFTSDRDESVASALQDMRSRMPVAPNEDVVTTLLYDDAVSSDIMEYADLLERNATDTDVGLAAKLRAACEETSVGAQFDGICSVAFRLDGKPRVRKANNKTEKRLGADGQQRLLTLHADICDRVAEVRAKRVEQLVYRLNEAALLCGTELLDRYQSIKRERGLIDYTDVEWRTWSLLTTSDYAEYMQYRLDARYKHILLDEFQDTNPLQWQILRTWLEASAEVQSQPQVFLVGDPKQSIYRFRRAEPRLFEMARGYLQQRYDAQVLELDITRRNAPPVVSVVNTLFSGLSEAFPEHVAYRAELPGTVQILPLFGADAVDQVQAERWRNPLDSPRADVMDRRREREAEELARRIGQMVGRWQINDGDEPRPLRFEDIYILVRRRTHLDIYERSLRHARIPYISSRQGGLLDTLEAADLTSLLQFLVIPFADIHLASALRSPVFSVSDADLLALSDSERSSWWQRLNHMVLEGRASEPLARANKLLGAWMKLVDVMPVHDLLDRIYFDADLMRRYDLAVPTAMRAGVAANLHAFMEVALSTDSGRYPSLQGFINELANMRRAAAEEAPDVGIIVEGSNAVRILTVHGAKGLEAPVVWLLDANSGSARTDSYEVLVDWPPAATAPAHFSLFSRKDERGESRAQLFEQEAALAAQEDINLLYVAMTRAQQVFIASGSESIDRGESWYAKIAAALDTSRIAQDLPQISETETVASQTVPPVEAGSGFDGLRRPLNVGGRSDDLVDPRRRQGTLVHALLEKCVPPAETNDPDVLRESLGVSDAEFESLWKAARSIIDEPSLSRFFDPGQYQQAFNELPYVSADGEVRRIDRVVEFDEEVWVLDYKTGDSASVDDLATAARPYLKQLESYRAAMTELMPKKLVRSALIFAGGLLYEAV